MRMEAVDINLSNAVLTQVKFSKLSQLLEVFNLDDLIVRSMENFKFFQWAVLKAVKVLQLVA